MKAHRRQELRENDLAHFLQESITYLQENGARVLLFSGAAVIIFALIWFTLQSRTQGTADGWVALSRLDAVESVEETLPQLREIADEAGDVTLATSALSQWGETALRLVLSSDDAADKARFNDEAAEAFERLLKRYPNNPLAVGVARCGLATVAENRFALGGDPSQKETARTLLAAVRDDPRLTGWPIQSLALNRLNLLDQTFRTVTFAPPPPEPQGPMPDDEADPGTPRPQPDTPEDKAGAAPQPAPEPAEGGNVPPDNASGDGAAPDPPDDGR
ncbi:MAG: hypothetical protein C4547_05840 [Phycisphaerales bacterium]|nr:MAG: hypothetical protein C4547_05840 [Phycisphaerales bacterium]